MKTLSDVVASLTEDQRHQIVADYDQFEEAGAIGDCEMRRVAYAHLESIGAGCTGIVRWMDMLVMEVLRFEYRLNCSLSAREHRNELRRAVILADEFVNGDLDYNDGIGRQIREASMAARNAIGRGN